MTKQELYLAIYQATSSADAQPGINWVSDFDRGLSVHVARNSGGEISYITLEFDGVRGTFLCSMIFDKDVTSFSNFTMPKVKLNPRQRAIVLLACVEFLMANDVINGTFEYYASRIMYEHQTGRMGFAEHYQRIRATADRYLFEHPELYRGSTPYEDLSQTFSF